MAILGVLLGITISILAAILIYGYHLMNDYKEFKAEAFRRFQQDSESISRLASRKAYAAEAEKLAESLPKKSGKVTMRTWNEDIGAVDAK